MIIAPTTHVKQETGTVGVEELIKYIKCLSCYTPQNTHGNFKEPTLPPPTNVVVNAIYKNTAIVLFVSLSLLNIIQRGLSIH